MSEHIVLLDDMVAVPGRRAELFDLFKTRYVPRAEERGLLMTEVFRFDDDGLILEWTLPDVAGFWATRRASMSDPEVATFWADARQLIARRTRKWRDVSFGPEVDEPEQPLPETSHHIVLLEDGVLPTGVRMSNGRTWTGVHLRGSVGPAHASLEVALEPGSDARLADVPGAVDVVAFGERVGGASRAPEISNGIKRTLLLRVLPETPPDVIDDFELDLLGMPQYIGAIRSWRLSRVESSHGGWTHCWEQEYEDVSGLQRDYMNHPYHWAHVDGWFDAEDPKCIVGPELVHVYYEIESSILTAAAIPEI